MTNGDRIREMTDSGLAEIILCPYGMDPDMCRQPVSCLECCEEWLEKECG